MLESAVEKAFNQRVRQLGGMTYKFAPLVKGNPDRLVLLWGEVFLVELKSDTGSLSERQKLWHRRALEVGVLVYVVSGSREARSWLPYI